MARSRVKNIRVPKGREDEYEKDAQGNLVHTEYGEDDEFDAVVLPSARGAGRHGTGGQHGAHFDPLGRDLKQRIIVFGDTGMPETVTETTGRELAAVTPKGEQLRDGNKGGQDLTKEGADQLGEDAEARYRALAAGRGQQQPQPGKAPSLATVQFVAGNTGAVISAIEEGLVAKKKAKKKATKKSRRGGKSDGVAQQGSTMPGQGEPPAEQEPNFVPVEIDIEAPFGRLRQMFSGLFRDGSNLILWTDARQVPSVYSLPKPDKPMPITIRWQDKVIPCVHAGIQFTLPHAPVTFTVLFIDEEQMDGEG